MQDIVEFLQHYAGLFTALGGLATVLGLAFGLYKASHNKHIRLLQRRIRDLKEDADKRGEEHTRQVQALEAHVKTLMDGQSRLRQDHDNKVRVLFRHYMAVKEKNGELNGRLSDLQRMKASATELQTQLDALNAQLDQVIQQDERVWERPASGPAFQPLPRRDVPIIAVLNLKGGVGKTTITANLAGLLAQQGKGNAKVLAIDADYQRSLSMMLIADKDRKLLHHDRKTLQHFLKGPGWDLPTLLYTAGEVTGHPGYCIVSNSDASPIAPPGAAALEDIGLEDVEMRLLAEWMFRRSGPDVRLRLREALHDLGLKEKGYRYVLIDCPPRLTTACINALAASDFFLIPVLLDATSARSVPNLLRTLRRLCVPGLFPHLRCLGIVANGVKFYNGKPIAREALIWQEQLPVPCRVAWDREVHQFRTLIPHSGRIAQAAGPVFGQSEAPSLAIADDEIRGVFSALLKEIKTRIDHESKQLAAVSA
jgi:cellulose biosynthesis protein BcsQ